MQQVHGHLEEDSLHVGLLQGRGHVHVHLQEPGSQGVNRGQGDLILDN